MTTFFSEFVLLHIHVLLAQSFATIFKVLKYTLKLLLHKVSLRALNIVNKNICI